MLSEEDRDIMEDAERQADESDMSSFYERNDGMLDGEDGELLSP